MLANTKSRELWREDARLDSILSSTEKDLRQAERDLSHRMDANTSRGLAAVRRIKDQLKLDGVYGTLAELMEASERFNTAVETTAGNSLFHYVVDDEKTATKVLDVLQRERSGRITFMPLNQLRPRNPKLPKATDAVPMIDKLKFDPHYEKAFQQVFGKTIICPDLTVASQYARSHGVSAITMDGDRSDKKGALSGGYHDKRQSRLEAVKNAMKCRQEHEAQKARSQEVKQAVEVKHQEVTIIMGELRKLEQTKQKQENNYVPLRQQLQSQSSTLLNRKDELEAKRRNLTNIDSNVKILTDQQNALETEISTEFKKALTADEESRLERLSTSIQELRKQLSQASSVRSELEDQKTTVEIELRESLRPRLEQLRSQAYDNRDADSGVSLGETQKELKRINKVISRIEKRLAQLTSSLEEGSSSITELEQKRADTRQKQEDLAKFIERQQKRAEKNMQKKTLLTKQAAEVNARIRDLGVLPQEAFAKFEKMKSENVVTRLKKVNDALKKYSHVNKKAFQQYEQFTNQREALMKRRAELDSSQASIEELIEVLDQRKDEAIERTFKQVSREFATVFETLVPAGRGRLIIQKKTDRTQPEEEDSEDERRESVESYTGVGISVSFNSKHDDQQRIQQLSGGQKSMLKRPTIAFDNPLTLPLLLGLCALTLIFAIQRCDPAPFYLFDEIDANLDAQYRTAVAQMLHSLSHASDSDGQFICTTFRPEMLLVAEKCYGVRYVGKSSTVAAVSRDEAMEFVQGAQQDGGGK